MLFVVQLVSHHISQCIHVLRRKIVYMEHNTVRPGDIIFFHRRYTYSHRPNSHVYTLFINKVVLAETYDYYRIVAVCVWSSYPNLLDKVFSDLYVKIAWIECINATERIFKYTT